MVNRSGLRADPLAWVAAELEELRARDLERAPIHHAGAPGPEVVVDGRSLVHLCSNNYLGLASDPRVIEAAAEAARRFGAGAGASRLVSGGTTLHRALEERLAALKGTEDCMLFSSGYMANAGTIPALAGPEDEILSDVLNHASVVDGCRLARAPVRVYRHADATHLEDLLARSGARRRLVVTDTVFSMDGDLAPLAAIVEACERHGAMLMLDEAHATGVLGPGGAGAFAEAGLAPVRTIVMGTLSKALGAAGGFVCGPRDLVALLRNRARTYVFDTAPPAPAIGAALAALDVAAREPERAARARSAARRLAAGLHALGASVPDPAACIVPLVLGEPRRALDVAAALLDAGVLAPAIRPPSVPEGTSRIRATTMAMHTEEHLERALNAFEGALR